MIILDTETTNLAAPEAAPIEQQPWVTEFAAIKVDDKTLKELERLEFMCRPKVPIPSEAVQITGITNEMVKDKPPFSAFVPRLIDFFLGERCMVAHNMSYDSTVLRHELNRLGRVTSFPWPPQQYCSVELTLHLKGYRLNLGALYEIATGSQIKEAHRAMADVESLFKVVKWLRKQRIL